MQVSNELDEVILTEELSILEVPDAVYSLVERADAAKIVIAPLLQGGNIVEHNGLKYEVVRKMGRERYIIKLVKPIKDGAD